MSGNADSKNPKQVAGGFKATIHNPHTSKEAKQHASRKLNHMDIVDERMDNADYVDDGGLSDEDDDFDPADMVTESDEELSAPVSSASINCESPSATGKVDGKAVHESHTKKRTNVLGGYKATLKNPNVGEEAKKHAEEVLKAEGAL